MFKLICAHVIQPEGMDQEKNAVKWLEDDIPKLY